LFQYRGWFAILLSLLFILSGCGKDVVQEDLLNYVNNELPKIISTEKQILEDYASVTGSNYTDDETLYDKMTEAVIPNYNNYIRELEKIAPATPEVRELHEQAIDLANIQQGAFIMIVSAIEKQDSAEIAQANEKLATSRKMARDWQESLKQLAEKHDVKLNVQN
jgi:hypothetical protein